MNSRYQFKKQLGLSLIELMIAITLGLLMTAALIEFFVSNKQIYRTQESLSRVQENGRFAVHFIATDVRMAGYVTCFSETSPAGAVAGTNNDGKNNSDSITVSTQTNDCSSASSTETILFEIADNPNGNPALFRTVDGGTAQELIEGIESMEILYGADTDGDDTPNYYVPAGTAGLNMESVVSVRVQLLSTSLEDNLTTQAGTMTVGGYTSPSDRKYRRLYTSTIAIRNRLS